MSSIQIINPIYHPGWDKLLLTHTQTTFFHTAAWAKVLERSYRYTPYYFTIIADRQLSGLIPMMEIKSIFTDKRGVSLPFTDECRPITRDAGQLRALQRQIIDYGRSAGWKHIELRGGGRELKPAHTAFLAHKLMLGDSPRKVFSTFRDSTQRNIKKARRHNIVAKRESSLAAVKKFYKLNMLTRREHGLPPQPWRFFEKVYEYIIKKNKGFVVLAYHRNMAVAGAVYFHFNNCAIYKYGASDKRFQHLRPNNLVMWEAVKWFVENGYQTFNFGRTALKHHGLLQFKRGWGTREETLTYQKFDLRRSRFVSRSTRITPFYPIFRKMPLPLLSLTGRLFYRHVG